MYQAWPWGGTAAAAPSPTSGFVQPATATGQVAAAATQWPAGYSQYAVTPEMQQQWAAWASQAQYAYSSTLPVGQVPTTTSYTTGYPEYQTAPNETKVSEASGKNAQSSAEKPKNPAEELVPSDSSELEKLKQLKEQAQQWKSQNLQQPAAASWPYSTAASNVSQTSTATTVTSSESSFKSHAIASTNTSDPGNAQQMDKDEEEFERQFKDWEKQFEAWKEQNINHPDKEAFAQYEKQWQEWRAQLLQKKEQMQKAKAERLAAAKTGGTDVQSVQPSTVVTSTVPGLNTINTQASIPSVPNVADPAVATAAASNSNLYYQTPQYMYVQPYVYPSTVPVVPPAVPQQYPYSGQGVTAPTGDNFVNQTQTVPPTGGPPPLSVPPPPINNPSMNIKNTKDFERNKEPFQYGQIRKDAPSQDTYQNFEGFENSNTYAPETDEQFKWNSGRGRARGRGRGRGRGTRGRGVGRWSENEAENRPGESLNKGPPGFHDNSGNFNENVTDGSAPPFEYPSEDFQGDSQFPKEQPGPRQNPPPGGRFPYQEEPRTYPPDGFDESFPPPAFERFPPDSERERFPPNSERDSFPPGPERGSFPPGPKRGPFPPGPERGPFPPGPERGPFPPGPDRGSFPPGPERGPFPPGPERGPFPPGPERGPFPPGPERGPFPPGPDRGPFPPGPDRGPFPPGPDRGPFPPGPDRGPFPPGPDRGPFPPGPERGPFPPGPERGPFPPGPPERGRFPPGPNRDRFPPGPEREGFPPGPQRKRFAPGPDQDSFPPGHEQDRFPPGPERDRFSKGPERERFPPGPERDRFPPGPDRDRFPPGPPGPEHDRFPPGPERDRFPPGRKGEGFPPGPEEEQFPPGPEGEQFPPAREREPLLPGNGRERFPPGPERERFPPGPDREGFPPGPERERFGPGPDRERFPPGPERDGFPPMPMEEERFMMERDFDRYPPEEDMYGPPPFREEFPPFDDRFPPGRGRFPGRGRRFPRGEFDRFGPPPPFAPGMQEDSPYGPPEFPPPDERFGFPGDGPIPPRMPPGRGILRAPFEPGFGPGPGPAGRGRFPDDRFFGERPPHFKSIDYTHKPASDVMGEDYDPHYEYESEFQSDVMQYRDNFSSDLNLAPRAPIIFSQVSVESIDYGHGMKPMTTSTVPAKKESETASPGKVFDYSHRRERSPLIREPPFVPERNGERPPVPFREREREPFRERDRNRDRDLDRDRGRKDNRERDRDNRERDRDNRERDRDNRERDRDNRDRDRDRERDRERERERDRERDQKRDRDRDWDRDRHKDESEREKRLKWDNNQENARNYAKDKVSNNSKKEMEVKNVDTTFKLPPEIFKNDISETALIEDLLIAPKRLSRPKQLVIILRGLPGSGKTYVAKLIKDKEIENGGSAPRILSLDDYFMVETEVTDIDSDTGKRIKRKEFKFEYESGMEEVYRSSLFKSFKKTIDDRFFPFIIVDAVHDKSKQYEQYWSYAKQRGFQVYIAEMDCKDPVICHKRNIHNRSLSDITKILENWEPKPRHFMSIDVRSLLQDVAITEVEMEVESSDKKEDDAKDENAQENDAEESSSFLFHVPSRWEKLEATEEKLDQLDGLRISKKKHSSMEDYLQLPDDYEERKCEPGKKRVRWADLEERKEQDRLRAIGFVVGQTDWTKLTDPTHADRALTKTKYF